ncbi:GNAT family N-acetyltransferase [Lacticaseibacillus brantae]|uniref:Alanine acetyl transferase n=1 Tax=Lacticaseibacillus brantae DSM 23927 TaxID=1423727 RepID=A0A0R2B7X9_9LACO|nr:GNAT family protein [Lacticaseibacillus brantae]KRM71715.1 alanine acetyl transferase [Lacticaseibacillus brantae DSM 23927]
MASFEKYHPIMSAHYTMDWLTSFTVKDIFALRHDQSVATGSGRQADAQITDTVTYVNQAMRLVMSNQALLYGIEDRLTQAFLGSFGLLEIHDQQAQVQFELLPTVQAQGVMGEVLPRMIGFAFFELGLTELTATVPAANTVAAHLLANHHFQAADDGRYTLTPDDIGNDPAYQF